MKILRVSVLFTAVAITLVAPTTMAAASFPGVNDLPVHADLPDVMTMDPSLRKPTCRAADWHHPNNSFPDGRDATQIH